MIENQKRLIGLLSIALLAFLSFPAAGQEKLSGVVAYSLKKIPPALDRAESLLQQGDRPNAKVYLQKAQREWSGIHASYKGKFDENHPEIVAARERLKAVEAKFAAQDKPDPKSDPEPGEKAGGAEVKGLPSTMVYDMKRYGPALDKVEVLVKAMEVDQARAMFDDKLNNWNTKKGWNKGKFDPQHPDVLALDARFAKVGQLVGQLGAKAIDASENLAPALEAVAESSKSLYANFKKASSAIRNLSSLRSDFDRGSESDMGKLRAKMDEIRLQVELVNAQLPDALAAARAFRKQYPDFKALDKLVRQGTKFTGREAGRQIERLEAFPANWLEKTGFVIKEALDEAQKNISMYGTGNLGKLKGSKRAVKVSAAKAAEHWVLDYSSIMLDMVPTLLPQLPQEAQAALPELVAARQKFQARADGLKQKIKTVAQAVSKVRKKMVAADLRRRDAARFPKSKFSGGKWKVAQKAIRGAWSQAIKGKKLVKISIYSPWEVRRQARWHNKRWVVDTYRYIGANCLAKLPSGKYRVFRMRFRNTKLADGSWSPLKQHSVGHVYDILKKNIGK